MAGPPGLLNSEVTAPGGHGSTGRMNILIAAAEMTPFVRHGNVGDAVAELAEEFRRQGHEVSVVLPCYRAIREGKTAKLKKTGVRFSVPVGPGRNSCEIFETKAAAGAQVFLVARDEYFDRSGIYGSDGRDYQDNAARFIFFTKCAIELARRMEPPPDLLQFHSWETGLGPVFCRDQRLGFRTAFVPHGLDYQGNFWSFDFGLTNLPGEYFSARGVEFYGSMNCLKAGLLFADAVVLPGERFAHEAQTPEYGCGLDAVLRENPQKIFGIPDYSDLEGWNPAEDGLLAARFSAAKPEARRENRAAFWKTFGLAGAPDRPAFVTFTEASPGVDSVLGALDRLLAHDVRVVLLGAVPPDQEIALEIARRKHAGRFAHDAAPTASVARAALAGTDFFLVPGPVEPREVWLRRAQRYGAIPIARQCGGLFQSVRDWEPSRAAGQGFVFQAATVSGVVDVCRRALEALADPIQAGALVAANLGRDISREATARAHLALYERLGAGKVRKAA
jgi:starch synthase